MNVMDSRTYERRFGKEMGYKDRVMRFGYNMNRNRE